MKLNDRFRDVTAGTALLLVLLTCGMASCSPRSQAPEERKSRPNVILISLDTLRADHLSCYGYERKTSPRIDAFAEYATRYTRAFATAPWTVPTHGSMFTGKLPFEHGAHTVMVDRPMYNVKRLPLEHLTLAEAISGEGYVTGAFVANTAHLNTNTQLNQGFETYHVERLHADKLNRRIFPWLDSHADKRFFLFINYIDTHRPYNTTPRPGFLDKPAIQDRGQLLDLLIEQVMPGTGPIPHDLVQQVKDQYDTALANMDEHVGALLDKLRTMGLYDKTMIVVTSDHGEYFGEHHLVEHSKDVYQEAMWVPLVIKNPGQQTGRVETIVTSSTDIPNLIFSQFPRDVAERYTTLYPDAPGNHFVISENYYTRAKDLFHDQWGHRFKRVRTVVYDWPYKYIHSSDGNHELYDLSSDPGETNSLIVLRPKLAGQLASILKEVRNRRTTWPDTSAPPPLNEKQIQRLKSLGYVR